MGTEAKKAIKIFFSYAQEDNRLRNDLDKHLAALKRSDRVETWYDHAIQAGVLWEDEIDTRLNTSDLILVLISHHFIATDYCYSKEMHRALERHEAGEAKVIPIILSPVSWEDAPIYKLKALPSEGKPITEWRNRNVAFKRVVEDIRKVVETLQNQQKETHQAIHKQRQLTIDTYEALEMFHQLMRTDTDRLSRVMYLIGEANMGKSHLLKHVFPVLAQDEYQARYILFDLRHPMYAIPDILNLACEQLGTKNCCNYYKALEQMKRPAKPEENLTQILTNFAVPDTSTNLLQERRIINDRLTTQFILDLGILNDKPLVLLFDTVNNASEEIQAWLIKTFLAKLSLLPHVRIVVAGRTLPDAPSDYIDLLQFHQLRPIEDEEEYILYCKQLNVSSVEQDIRTLVRECNYTPGLFANFLSPTLVQRGAYND